MQKIANDENSNTPDTIEDFAANRIVKYFYKIIGKLEYL